MYRLENNVEWTTDLKNAFKHNITRAKILWSGAEINEQNNLQNLTLDEQRYISNLGFIGTATAKKLEINLIDLNNSINLEDKEIIMKLGADYNGNTYYINYGSFIIDKAPEIDATNGKIRIVAYDYMIKFNKPFISRVTYPCTLLTLLQDVCSQAEVVLGSDDFPNKNFVVQDNQFEGATLREVLQNIGKCAFSWARIGQDNKLYLDFNLTADATETITIDDYIINSFKKANEYYGPINQVTYADSNIQGQEERVKDQQSIDENGLKELVIYDNLFAYTPEKRSELIQAGTRLLGLTYMPITQLDLIGLAYLDCCDIINIGTLDNETFESRVFSHTIKYNGALTDGIITEGTSNNEEAYKNTATTVFQDMQTRFIIDKANKRMDAVIEDVNRQNTKISQVTQTVDELNSKISDIADITTSQESTNAKVFLERINESEPITIRVRPTGSNISFLYPRANLYPSPSLYMTTRTIRFTNLKEYKVTGDSQYTSYKRYYSYDGTSYTLLVLGVDYQAGNYIFGIIYENEYIDYELPMNLLWYDAENYDEFLLDYDSQTCQVRKKVQYNADGTTSLLPEEVVYNFTYPRIYLDSGDYEIELLGYAGAYIFVRLMTENIYSTQWATKAELHSEMSQTKNEISAEVTQTLSNYSTTDQVQSSINMKAGEITTQIVDTYETKDNATTNYSRLTQTANSLQSQINNNDTDISTLQQTASGLSFTVSQKVGNDEVISKINQSVEAVTILANKLGLTANDIINLIAGNAINLSSKNISINSNNFNVDKYGNVTITDNTGLDGSFKIETPGYYETSHRSFGSIYKGPNGYVNIEADFASAGGTIFVAPSENEMTYGSDYTFIQNGNISALSVTQRSKESVKKNIEKYLENASDIVKNSEIYIYNFKSEDDTARKHIGFVIGDEGGNYKTPDEVVSNGEGIDLYAMISILWKAFQEQQEIIERLQKEIKEMKEGK